VSADRDHSDSGGIGGVSYRALAGGVLALLLLLFLVLNRDQTRVSFVIFDAQTDLWLALLIAAGGGFVAGFLMSRARYRR
jgi:uncharacterized integral membrane protein